MRAIAHATALVAPVRRFVTELAPALSRLSTRVTEADVAVEAFDLAASFVDADARHTDAELTELAVAFAPWLHHLAGTGPAELRRNELVAGKRRWKDSPSAMFEVLVAADRRDGTRSSWRYYELAMDVAHTVCSLDAHPAAEELADLDRYRTALLAAMRSVGVHPPGRPGDPAATTSAAAAAAPPAAEPMEPAEPVEALLAELDDLIGLAAVKAEVRLVANLLQVQRLRKERGLPVVEGSRHLVFTGNPGTGKTTVARLLSRLYRSLGVVDRGHLVETDRSGLVAGFVGQTAIRVRETVERAIGGVLLIDEAYALARGGERDFGQEAIDTLVKMMEDHREDLVIIAAGYPDEMGTFVDSNPGLRSRFPKTIFFEDYSDEELQAIVGSMTEKNGYRLASETGDVVLAWFAAHPRTRGFGNGRLARNLFEEMVARHASRVVSVVSPSDDDLVVLVPADVPPVPPAAPTP